jgi:hypothetical protein
MAILAVLSWSTPALCGGSTDTETRSAHGSGSCCCTSSESCRCHGDASSEPELPGDASFCSCDQAPAVPSSAGSTVSGRLVRCVDSAIVASRSDANHRRTHDLIETADVGPPPALMLVRTFILLT